MFYTQYINYITAALFDWYCIIVVFKHNGHVDRACGYYASIQYKYHQILVHTLGKLAIYDIENMHFLSNLFIMRCRMLILTLVKYAHILMPVK